MKIAIIGANGQLGSDLGSVLGAAHEVAALTHHEIEIADEAGTFEVLEKIRPEVILNTAAFHNVPKCEEEPRRAAEVNIIGTQNIAKAASRLKAELIHYSTDYVFDGVKKVPYAETDLPNPLNFYALTKLASEHTARIYCENHKILRVGGIYGKIPCRAKGGVNFVSAMLRQAETRKEINVVSDEFITPTYTMDIARQTELLLGRPETGIFHVSNGGYCSWFEFAKEIFSLCGLSVKVNPIPSSAYTSLLKRPSWSVLENGRLKALGIYRMQTWQKALKEHLQNLGYE